MILELLYFFLILFVVYVYGIVPFVLLKKQLPINPFTPMLIGFPILGVLSQWFFVSGAINFFVFIVVLVGAIVSIWRYSFYFQSHFANLKNCLKSFSIQQKIASVSLLFIIAYQSALPTKINDLGMYYLQTLQWMEKYGVVSGVGNLHPALGLGSAWHSVLALFDFIHINRYGENGETIRFLGLNGSLVFSFFLFLLVEIKTSSSYTKWFLSACAIFVLPICFMYLTAPSPDLPVLFYTSLVLYWFFLEKDQIPLVLFVMLACFVFACKPPALTAVALCVWMLGKQLRLKKNLFLLGLKNVIYAACMALFCLAPVIYKNIIQTGYPLYPAPYGAESKISTSLSQSIYGSTAKIPADWNEAYRKGVVTWGLNDSLTKEIFKSDTQVKKSRIQIWLTRPGYKGFMNKLLFLNAILSLFLLCLGVFKLREYYFNQQLERNFVLPILLVSITFLDWYLLSQYRLMLPTAVGLFSLNSFLFYSFFFKQINGFVFPKKVSANLVLIFPLLYGLMAFMPMSAFKDSSRNKDITQSSGFTPNYLLLPFGRYQGFEPIDSFQVDSQYVYFYPHQTYAWDCPIPAASHGQQYYVQEVFQYKFRSNSSKTQDGFYLEKK
ncbi:MAG: hypothetical protein CFE21_11430 [Bacteroidetes bacterium B1(2017)]|nr:MAG: hypothetical protein CFE21_11430 [Bacteroidetes bacterium B1(2017)]